ncbi:hypothetical protein M7I_8324 [Glarea lozoyensis 74030]|uniref:Uncharacterized protein n=1 Tax=Glarea lozoyensis (strain ATCC 74030 / MF5533) TaxID=1104152 RepID=H0EZP8_GLAL7|nr:hypothetical protein M7I_8324 [Glarea lozoyensis 74030]
MSGGVHNLRAMFENKNSEERPEDRGRSPGGSSMGKFLPQISCA